MSHTSKIKALLSDLGRSTKRGVKKCPSCGTYNGTRTVVCKTCYIILRPNNKKVPPSEVCQLLTSYSSSQIFSYISSDDTDMNERGFVYFPELKNKDTKNKLNDGICMVRYCAKSSVLKCHETDINPSNIQNESCKHVQACFDCATTGVALKIDQPVLESFRVPQNVKQEVWSNFLDKKKPYLQRVSENIFVVRCKITPQNTLGYLHCIIGKYNQCFSCTTTLVTVDQMDQIPDLNTYFCCHYIACLSAIASSRYMVQEFEKNLSPFVSVSTLSTTIVQLDSLPIVEDAMVEGSNGPVTFFEDQMIITSETCVLENITPGYHQISLPNIIAKKRSKREQNHSKVQKLKKTEEQEVVNPNPTLSFERWLSSITERINQEMHYQFDGNPPTMVFHVHKTFFECFRERMCAASAKKRLPNSTVVFVKHDSLPLGTFTKYTWHITNIMLVKKIFETSAVPLKISRSFIKTSENTYEEFEHDKIDKIPLRKPNQPIQPNDVKTFLKVGIVNLQQKEPIPFVIEWIPDVLPITQIGELRLTFKYGHMPPKEK
ncbi:uncharacterized protein C2orf42-like isoform X1 [Adelges cooleyi]|uniref:uncharacterized protein C2orf42-like isoform X1 n=1 Tax=Adelges cooleyi TaxID=133065 RepID=UPI0021800688|nr:uncharacterized protein C2orf42-like isoform X1 [Adelges cooleyi]XP_050431799.1 uncharacterized protein C2orf42-like isoform X1 [Adelges cooleyi]